MKPLKRQGGFLVETVLGLVLFLGVVAAFIIPMQLEEKRNQDAQEYAEHIRFVISQIHHFQHFKMTVEGIASTSYNSWPKNFESLIGDYPTRFWNSCSNAAEQQGQCVRPDYVPWTNDRVKSLVKMDIASAPFNYHFIMTIPLSTLTHDPKEFMRWGAPLMKIPGASQVLNDIVITLRPSTLALMFDDVVMRNGEATLTADWDVGNKAISNAKDFTIRNADGTQTYLSEWLTQSHIVRPGETLNKPSCPDGMKPNVYLGVSNIDVTYPYSISGSIKPYVSTDAATTWTVDMDVYVTNLETGAYSKLNTGEILATTQCQKQ